MTAIRKLMADRHISLSDVSHTSHVPRSTLAHAWNKPVNKWTVRILVAFAQGLDCGPEQLLETLRKKPQSNMKTRKKGHLHK